MKQRDKKTVPGTYLSSRRIRLLAFFLAVILAAHGSWGSSFPGGITGRVQAEEGDSLPEELAGIHAKSAVLMDADSGRVLVSREGDTMRPMASTTKILTCILTLETANLEDTVTASANAVSQPRVHLGMEEGEQFLLEDLLYSLMLESHNDSAVAIAEHVAGSVEAFAVRMNEKAREIGCENAHFVTPNGLDAQDQGGVHSISAEDLARILSYCISWSPQAERFLDITRTGEHSFSSLDRNRSFSCRNQNAFLGMMEGALTGKTGFTGDAGYCYVGALRQGERTFVVALLACGWPGNSGWKWEDTRALMEYGLNHYTYRNVWQEPELTPISVKNGIPGNGSLAGEARTGLFVSLESWQPGEGWPENLPAPSEGDFSLLLGEGEEVHVEVETAKRLEAPVASGEKAGEVRYYLGDTLAGALDIVTAESVRERDFPWLLEQVLGMWMKGEIAVTG